VSARSIDGALAKIAGGEHVVTDGAPLAAAAIDGITPRWLVRVSDVEQVSAVLALAAEESLAVVPRGSGSALDLGLPPARVDLVLDLAGMDRVVEDNPADLTASVEAGLTAGALAARLTPRGQWLPVDPPGVGSRTLGGLVATAARGSLRVRYGTLRDLVLGVRFVQADGVVTWGGARVVKSVTGYDVPKLMVGSLGTLGVLCELTLRLHPRPEFEATRLFSFGSPEAAGDFVARLLDSTIEPTRVELLNGPALGRLGLDARIPAGIAVSIGSIESAVHTQLATLDEWGQTLTSIQARAGLYGSQSLTPGFWERYGGVEEGSRVVLQVSGLPSRVGATVRAVEEVVGAVAPDQTGVVAGCAALGTFDVMLGECAVGVAVRLVERVRGVVAEAGGHTIVRRAAAAVRRAVDPWGPVEPEPMALMRALRDEFDPRRVLNPGRFVGGL
jgi:glycolate oxidase FAD binding subunit